MEMLTKYHTKFSGIKSRIGVGSVVYESLQQACELLNKPYDRVYSRLYRGWTIEEAFELIARKQTTYQKQKQQKLERALLTGYKVCSVCNENKAIEKFPKHSSCLGGVAPVCRFCKTSATRFKRYGVSHQQYTEMYIKQDGKCAICSSTNPNSRAAKDGSKSFCVDHCHVTGEIRGLLCFKCNSGLGNFMDSTEKLKNAINYLSREKKRQMMTNIKKKDRM